VQRPVLDDGLAVGVKDGGRESCLAFHGGSTKRPVSLR
jgi:hypothetical protein